MTLNLSKPITKDTMYINKQLRIFILLLLSFALNLKGMGEPKDIVKGRHDKHYATSSELRVVPSLDLPCSTTTTVQNCNNNYKKSVSNDNKNKCNPINNNTVNVTVIGAIGSELLKLLNPEKYQGLISGTGKLVGLTGSWIIHNKKLSAACLIGSIYLAINAQILYLHSKLTSTHCWSQWRSNLAIEELYLIPRQTFYNDLLTNIQTKYTNFRNFRDSLAPLSNFLEDTEKEESYIKQFESIIKVLKLLHVSGLIFYSNDFYKQLTKRASRLLFIKSAFLNWYAERKLSSPERELLVRRFPGVKNMLNINFKDCGRDVLLMPSLVPEESIEHILENIIII